eukprot:TRINITY_DN16606_c0_g1_i1.p3 TRINITY_DN16606_c0_g1~~TRINITY_DN16606_c0_g1_i1.p3  ORF type:complete len:106 (-),score=32.37 TRINITY_DN16606_c0_g1_i1:227-544(-)
MSTAATSFQGEMGVENGPNRENIKEMRRTHFEVGFQDDDNDTTHRTTFHRHPFLQAKANADKVAELRRTNWQLGHNQIDYTSTQAATYTEGPGSPAYPQGIQRRF